MRIQSRTLSFLLAAACVSAAVVNAQHVIATIPVANSAGAGAADSRAKLAYLPTGTDSNGASQVTVVNERNQTIARYITLPTDFQATSAALNYVTGRLYVGAESGGLFDVNPRTGRTIASVNVNAVSVAVNSLTNKIYASDFEQNLYVVDGASNMIDTIIPIQGIQNIAVNPVTNRIYAAVEFNPGMVAVVDGKTNQVIAEPKAASGLSSGVAVDPLRDIFYSSDTNQLSTSGTGTVSMYSGKKNTLTTSVTLEGFPALVVEDPLTFTIYASNLPENTVDIIDGSRNKLIDSVPVGMQPQYMTDDPINRLLYVGCQGPNDANGLPTFVVYVIRTDRVPPFPRH